MNKCLNHKKYSPHLKFAKNYWANHLEKNSIVIDATLGNGFDTLFLANLDLLNFVLQIYGYDIQNKAIENASQKLKNNLSKDQLENVFLINKSHVDFSDVKSKVDLIIYNLGYLPTTDKSITTMTKTTLISIQAALNKLSSNGAISITCYPGHLEGEKEERAILEFLKTLNRENFEIRYHKWQNRDKSPSLIWIKKKSFLF
jgi:tRNA1(Val) A37 N6-methylase TrmN6